MKTLLKTVSTERTVELLFTRPKSIFKICFPIMTFPDLAAKVPPSGLAMDFDDAKLFLEHISGGPDKPYSFDSDIALYKALCEVLSDVDDEDIEVTAYLITDEEEKCRYRSFLTDYFGGNDTSWY